MNWLEAIILGIVQGATEFLPVSSSGHLVLVSWWLGFDSPPLAYSVTVHLGTTLAVLIYFWKDWQQLLQAGIHALRTRDFTLEQNPQLRLLVYLIMASIPAGIVGLLLADYFEAELSTPVWVSFNLFITAGLLTYGEWWMRSETKSIDALESEADTPIKTVDSLNLSLADAIIVGMAQALAILPGISRSGSTIAIGMARGLGRQAATRFSFLLATPIILAAGFKESLDLALGNTSVPDDMTVVLLLGLVSSAGVGYASIAGLLRLIRHIGFYGFAVYCVVFGMLSLGAILVRG